MRIYLIFVLFAWGGVYAEAQGTVLFNTHVPGIVDSRWVDAAFQPLGPEWGSRLFQVSGPTLIPLSPITRLQAGPASELGYVEPVVVSVPDVPAGQPVRLAISAFPWGNPDAFVGLFDTVVTLGGGDRPPAYLTGLPERLLWVPEPSVVWLFTTSVGVLLLVGGSAHRRCGGDKP